LLLPMTEVGAVAMPVFVHPHSVSYQVYDVPFRPGAAVTADPGSVDALWHVQSGSYTYTVTTGGGVIEAAAGSTVMFEFGIGVPVAGGIVIGAEAIAALQGTEPAGMFKVISGVKSTAPLCNSPRAYGPATHPVGAQTVQLNMPVAAAMFSKTAVLAVVLPRKMDTGVPSPTVQASGYVMPAVTESRLGELKLDVT